MSTQSNEETTEQRPAGKTTETAEPRESWSRRQPDRVGPYTILEQIGEGGMGVVYLAEQTEPIRRRVALKIIKLGMDTKAVVARFESERQALAMMDHPNVAKVLDAGATEQGRPYFVMEHVQGEPITDYCDRHRLATQERLELFMVVCHAVQHAHHKAIIHRDIKPSNILVAFQEGKPVPKVIDFGVAKATEHKLTEKTLFTEQGQLIGTPEYMSPEQAEMSALSVDTRTDVYSLGVVLYELLVGALPFEPRSLRQAAFGEIQRIIREKDPPRPSTRLSSLGDLSGKVAHKRRTNRVALEKQLRGDLDWITMKAMDKDRTLRYDSALDLASDVVRHVNSEPVLAGPPKLSYRLRKALWKRRHVAAMVAFFLVILAATLIWGVVQEARRDAAKQLLVQVVKLYEAGANGEAQRKLDRARSLDAELVELSAARIDAAIERSQRLTRARQLIEQAITLYESGNREQAYGKLASARSLDPTNFRIPANAALMIKDEYFSRESTNRDNSSLEMALQECRLALQLNAESAGTWNLQATLLYSLGDLVAAEEACRKAIAVDGNYFWSLSNLAKVLALRGKLEQAMVAARRGTEIQAANPSEYTHRDDGVWLTLGTLQLLHDEPQGRKTLERAQQLDPGDSRNYLMLARAGLNSSLAAAREEALEAARRAVEIATRKNRKDPRYYRVLAMAYLRAGHYAQAEENARTAIEHGDERVYGHFIRAAANARLAQGADGAADDHQTMAREQFELGNANWPTQLIDGAPLITAEKGLLWFDRLAELQSLRSAARELIDNMI